MVCCSLMYNELIGGALALTKDQFLKANGWSNLYWGWGVSFLSLKHNIFTFLPLKNPSLKMTVS